MVNIFLIGFMGTGKSAVGKELTELIGLPFIDTDELIVQTNGMSINDIFSTHGEPYFRDLETDLLKKIAESSTSAIVATGGGMIERQENREMIHRSGKSIFLDTEWDLIKERLCLSSDRPLARKENDWSLTHELFLKRAPYYEQADIIIKTEEKSAKSVAMEIIEQLDG